MKLLLSAEFCNLAGNCRYLQTVDTCYQRPDVDDSCNSRVGCSSKVTPETPSSLKLWSSSEDPNSPAPPYHPHLTATPSAFNFIQNSIQNFPMDIHGQLSIVATPELSDILHIATSPYYLRSSSSTNLTQSPARLNTMGFRTFSRSAPQLWNSLPPDIQNMIYNPCQKSDLGLVWERVCFHV